MRAVGVMRDGRALAAAGSLGLLSISCGQRGEVSRKVSVAPTAAAVAKPSLYTSAVEARRWIDLALARNLHESLVKRIDQECSGRSFQLGHFSKPFEAHEATKAVRVAFDLIRGLSGAIEKTTDNTFTSVNTTVVGPGLLWKGHDGEVEQGPFSVAQLEHARLELAESSPFALLTAARESGALMLAGNTSNDWSGDGTVSVTFTGDDKVTRALLISRRDGTVTRCTRLNSDPMLGDETFSTEYEYAHPEDTDPSRITRLCGGRVEFDVHCTPASSPFPDPLAIPPAYETQLVVPPVSGASTTMVARVSDNLYAVTFSALDSRSLFLVLSHTVYVFEAPYGDEAGKLLLDTIRREVPSKPIQYLFLTHHHPDHAGGLRPFVAAGIKIVTTPGNVPYFQSVASERHALRPDEQWIHPRAAQFELVSGRRSFRDGDQLVEAIDLGAASRHTDEFLVFYFPTAKIVFEGDLVKAQRNGEPLKPAGDRALGLYQYLNSSGLQVDRIVSSWPAGGRAISTPFADLAEMVRLRSDATGRP